MAYSNPHVLPYSTGFREPHQFDTNQFVQQIALESIAQGGSDLYFQTGQPVLLKLDGNLCRLTQRKLSTEECLYIVDVLAGSKQASGNIAMGGESKSSYSVAHPSEVDLRGDPRRYRFRCNAIGGEFRSDKAVQIVLRLIRSTPPTIAEMKIEEQIVAASTPESGMVYITGATGAGKSTTFAALIRNILEGDTPIKGNIIMIESPIEYVFDDIESQHSVVLQAEVGRDIDSFANGIVFSMRHDPSLIVVGETRDKASADAALAAALTGHLVYTTLHANDVPSIFPRMLSFYPPDVHTSSLYSIVDSARLLMNQRLVPAVGGGRVALREFLALTDEMREDIVVNSDPTRISGVMKSLLYKHGRPMSVAVQEAYDAGLISETVYRINRDAKME